MKVTTRYQIADRRGTAVMEFALSLTFFIPLLLGTLVFGFRLIRSIQMSQVTRDIGHMYLRGIDFRNPGPQANAATLASGFDLTSGGTSELILSKVKLITQADCDAANAVVSIGPGSSCANLNKTVFMEQLRIGNTSGGNSAFGTPTPLQADFSVSIKDQGRATTAQTGSAFTSILVLQASEFAYVAEMINQTPD